MEITIAEFVVLGLNGSDSEMMLLEAQLSILLGCLTPRPSMFCIISAITLKVSSLNNLLVFLF